MIVKTELARVDPELRPVLGMLPPMSLTAETLETVRHLSARRPPATKSESIEPEEVWIKGHADGPQVRIIVFRPKSVAGLTAGILHIHGGGYVMGSADMDRAAHTANADTLGCIIVAVDYRLAPETSYPGALEDCYAALHWLHGEAEQLGVDRQRIGVSGSSAGAGLAAALALFVRARGEALIAFQHLAAPMIDDRTCLRPPNPHVGQYIWTPGNNLFGWTALLGREPGGPDIPPFAAAAREDDLKGLPPTYLAVGALDLFLQENLTFVNKLAQAGVAVELHVYPGAFHGFLMVETAGVTRQATRDSLSALARFCQGRDPRRGARTTNRDISRL
jgi:triacylglycerol lipase